MFVSKKNRKGSAQKSQFENALFVFDSFKRISS